MSFRDRLRMEGRALFCIGLVSATLVAGSEAHAQPEDPLSAPSPASRLTVPLVYDGAYRGDVPVNVDGDRVAIWIEPFIRLMGSQLSPEMAAKIRSSGMFPISVDARFLNEMGIKTNFNRETLELEVSIPLDAQGRTLLSAADPAPLDERDFLTPSKFAASATFLVSQRHVWQSQAEPEGFKPVQASVDLAANVGGPAGVFLFSQHSYDGQTRKLTRGNSQAVIDFSGPAVRASLGDVAPQPVGFQTAPLLGGIGIQRAWSELQPLRNIRPSGQASFVLDRPSTIDVIVNGAVVRSLQLQPGKYDLSQLPFLNGLNQVELYVQDEQGRRLLTSFSQFYNAQLLAKGLLDFSITGGLSEDLSGSGSRYRGSAPAVSGWVRYGVSNSLTIGTNFQAGRNVAMGGIESVLATPIGSISAVASFSHVRGRSGQAFLVGYESRFGRIGPFSQVQVNVDWRGTSSQFSQLDKLFDNPNRSQILARVTANAGKGISGGLSYARYAGHAGSPDRSQFSFQMRKTWGNFDLTCTYDRATNSTLPTDNRILLTATIRLGRSQDLRTSFDSRRNTARLEYARFARDEIGALGLRAGLEKTEGAVNAVGQAAYNSNNFRLGIDHRLVRGTGSTVGFSQETQYTATTQIAFAGGTFALGRPVGPRFAIVKPHRTLRGSRLSITDGAIREHPQAESAHGRPSLVGLGSPYLPSRIKIDVEELPVGYDIGPGEYQMKPAPVSGFSVPVGSDASRMVIGVALDALGQPLSQLGGTLLPLDKASGEPVLVFTNRNGRFIISGLTPGRYQLSLGAEGRWKVPVTVPKDAKDIVALGNVQLNDEQGAD